MKKLKLAKLINEEMNSHRADQFWTIEYNKEDSKLFLLYKGETAATIKKDSMDKICDTWRKIR